MLCVVCVCVMAVVAQGQCYGCLPFHVMCLWLGCPLPLVSVCVYMCGTAAALLPLCPCIVRALPKELKMAKEIPNPVASGFARSSSFSFSFLPSAPLPLSFSRVGGRKRARRGKVGGKCRDSRRGWFSLCVCFFGLICLIIIAVVGFGWVGGFFPSCLLLIAAAAADSSCSKLFSFSSSFSSPSYLLIHITT